jgi:TonB family protein
MIKPLKVRTIVRNIFLLYIILFSSINMLHADSEYGSSPPELVRLYESSLVVDANLIRHNSEYFWVRVNEVIRDSNFGIKEGDYLRILNVHSGDCGFLFNIGNYKRGRFYLQKKPGSWSLYKSQASSVCLVSKDTTYFVVGTHVHYDKVDKLHQDLIQFQRYFGMHSENKTFYATHSDEVINNKALNNKIIQYFEENDRFPQQREIVENPVFKNEPQNKVLQSCAIMDEPPEYGGGYSELREFIYSNLKHPLPESGIEGKVILKFEIQEDGSVKDSVEVIRGVHSMLDKEAVRVIEILPDWKPATIRGRASGCLMVLPIKFEL